jgi:hypothetical protein
VPWFRVDDGFHSHPKALATSLEARGLWATAGSWSSAHLTDGVVPDHVLESLGGTPELAEELVANGLWRRRKRSYVFHDFLSRNPSREAVENERKNAAERQRRRREAMSSRRDKDVTHAVSHTTPTRTSYGSTNGRARDPAAAARSPNNPKPPWCGVCDQQTRQTGDPPGRCPTCHPLATGIEADAWRQSHMERT